MAKGFFSRFKRTDETRPAESSPGASLPPELAVADVAEIVRGIARQGLPAASRKAAISLRLDAEVLDWFKAQGPGYQTRMNAVLRAFMEAAS